MQKPTGGWKANAYVIFDYFSPTDFKFAGIDVSTNKIVMGHRNAQGWIVDAPGAGHRRRQRPTRTTTCWSSSTASPSPSLVNGTRAFTYTFAPRWIDGVAVRPEQGPGRRRLRQLARHLRQLRGAGAAAAVDLRRHRGLQRRRRRPLHRRRRRHLDGHVRAATPAPAVGGRRGDEPDGPAAAPRGRHRASTSSASVTGAERRLRRPRLRLLLERRLQVRRRSTCSSGRSSSAT